MAEIIFKELSYNQSVLYSSNLLDYIPKNHPVLIVNQVVDGLNIDCLLSRYKGGGTSAYHPRMLFKVLFYAYRCNIYSCRKIAKTLEEKSISSSSPAIVLQTSVPLIVSVVKA